MPLSRNINLMGSWMKEPVIAEMIDIANYYGNKRAAVSYTFDDGLQSQLDFAVPALNAFGFKGTFNLIAGLTRDRDADPVMPNHEGLYIGSWESWARVAAQGHEIGNHSFSHPEMMTLTDARQIDREVNCSAEICAAKIGYFPLTFAYPYTHFNPEIDEVVLQRHIAIRLNEAGFGSELPTVEAMNAAVAEAIRERRWLAPMMHGFATGEYGAVIEPAFSRHLAFTQAHLAEVWVDTYGNVSRYLQEWCIAEIVLRTASARRLTFTVTCTLDPAIFNHPLTVRIPTTAPVHTVSALLQRNGMWLPVSFTEHEILVDVVPGSGPVDVQWR